MQVYTAFPEAGNRLEINHIHGQLNKPDNPLIFGFGDELDDDYLQLENEKVKGVLDKMKSFGYVRNENYRNLIRFIDKKIFRYLFSDTRADYLIARCSI